MVCRGAGGAGERWMESGKQVKMAMFSIISRGPADGEWEGNERDADETGGTEVPVRPGAVQGEGGAVRMRSRRAVAAGVRGGPCFQAR